VVCGSEGDLTMILSQKQIEEIAATVTKNLNVFFFDNNSEDKRTFRANMQSMFSNLD
jgi:hypothetical protein